jgi:rRNA maturation RNase YbeY
VKSLNVFYEDIRHFKIDKLLINSWTDQLIASEGKLSGSINIIFCSDEYLEKINREYLNHNFPTDIITFNYNDNNLISGDLFIGVNQVKLNAAEYLQNFKTELCRVIFHGVLHLCGYNDKNKTERKIMTEMEDKYLREFKLIN